MRLKWRFALLRSCLIALRGFRGKHYKKDVPLSEIAFNILGYHMQLGPSRILPFQY